MANCCSTRAFCRAANRLDSHVNCPQSRSSRVQNAFDMMRQGAAAASAGKPAASKASGSKAAGAAPAFQLNAHTAASVAGPSAAANAPIVFPSQLAHAYDQRQQHNGPQVGDAWWSVLLDFVPLALLQVLPCALQAVTSLMHVLADVTGPLERATPCHIDSLLHNRLLESTLECEHVCTGCVGWHGPTLRRPCPRALPRSVQRSWQQSQGSKAVQTQRHKPPQAHKGPGSSRAACGSESQQRQRQRGIRSTEGSQGVSGSSSGSTGCKRCCSAAASSRASSAAICFPDGCARCARRAARGCEAGGDFAWAQRRRSCCTE